MFGKCIACENEAFENRRFSMPAKLSVLRFRKSLISFNVKHEVFDSFRGYKISQTLRLEHKPEVCKLRFCKHFPQL